MLLQLREYTKIDRQMHTQTHTHTYSKTQCLSQSAKTLRKYFEKFSERLRWPPAACKSGNERCTKLTFIYSFQLGFLFSFSMRALPKKNKQQQEQQQPIRRLLRARAQVELLTVWAFVSLREFIGYSLSSTGSSHCMTWHYWELAQLNLKCTAVSPHWVQSSHISINLTAPTDRRLTK